MCTWSQRHPIDEMYFDDPVEIKMHFNGLTRGFTHVV